MLHCQIDNMEEKWNAHIYYIKNWEVTFHKKTFVIYKDLIRLFNVRIIIKNSNVKLPWISENFKFALLACCKNIGNAWNTKKRRKQWNMAWKTNIRRWCEVVNWSLYQLLGKNQCVIREDNNKKYWKVSWRSEWSDVTWRACDILDVGMGMHCSCMWSRP